MTDTGAVKKTLPPWSGDGINVTAASPGYWRVTDQEEAAVSGAGLLGFILAIADLYEVRTIGRPLERSYFGSLAAAIDSFRPRLLPLVIDAPSSAL